MADVYCDQSLGSGNDDGTDWTNAYKLLATALNGTNVGNGDTLWVKNDQLTSGTVILKGTTNFSNDPPRVIGVKSATTATPPAAGDIIPGLRNGSSTRAYDQTSANAAPIFSTSVSGADLTVEGYFGLVYGLVLKGRRDFRISGSNKKTNIEFDECELLAANGQSAQMQFGMTSTAINGFLRFKNCKFSQGTHNVGLNANNGIGIMIFQNCIIDLGSSPQSQGSGKATFEFYGCDFVQSGTLRGSAGGQYRQTVWKYNNCQINASSALVTGSISEGFRTEFAQTSSVAGKTTGGSFLELDIITSEGDIVLETTAVRTGGADDGGDGAWSLAFTPGVNGTRDNLVGLIGPKMAVEVVGDGTSQTLTVNIANSGGGDYNDDDVWLEAKSPSEAGTADFDFYTTQMDLEATPSVVADDTGSTWGTGGNNHQKLTIALAPDYDGIIECWVVFAKNFGASPETLYVDPLPTVT